MTATATSAPPAPPRAARAPLARRDLIRAARLAARPWFWLTLDVEPVPCRQLACNLALAAVIMLMTALAARGLLGRGPLMVVITYLSTLLGLKTIRIRLPRQQKGQEWLATEANPRTQKGEGQ
jgi:hypothetical protein